LVALVDTLKRRREESLGLSENLGSLFELIDRYARYSLDVLGRVYIDDAFQVLEIAYALRPEMVSLLAARRDDL